jgi:hypothetical protein
MYNEYEQTFSILIMRDADLLFCVSGVVFQCSLLVLEARTKGETRFLASSLIESVTRPIWTMAITETPKTTATKI